MALSEDHRGATAEPVRHQFETPCVGIWEQVPVRLGGTGRRLLVPVIYSQLLGYRMIADRLMFRQVHRTPWEPSVVTITLNS